MKKTIGVWSFTIGLALAGLLALVFANNPPAIAVVFIAILGLIVGVINITDKEVQLFLIASIAFMLSFQALGAVSTVLLLGWKAVSTFFSLMTVFIAPAAAIVACKALYEVTKD